MKTAIIVSGVVRNMVEASSSWKIDGDYFLIADEYMYKRRTLYPFGRFDEEFTNIIKKTKVSFSSITIPSINNIEMCDSLHNNSIINMLWKWKCSYYALKPYHDIKNYDKFIIIRPDIYINILDNFNFLNDFIVNPNTIHTIKDTHIVFKDNNNLIWMNDIFLLFDINVFYEISKIYDFYVNNYLKIIENEFNIHTFLGMYFKNIGINISGDIFKFIEFTILTEWVCNNIFYNGHLKPEYNFNDVCKHVGESFKDISFFK
jgi:hypothetical protein